MKRVLLLAVAAMLTYAVYPAIAEDKTLEFPLCGFSINPLEEKISQTTCGPITMALPVSDGFSPNVNVQIQPYPDTLDNYIKLSQDQFKNFKFEVISSTRKGNSIIWEYSGKMSNNKFHWYAIAIKKGNNIYLATGTTLEKQWQKYGDKIRTCVDSFKLNK